MVEMIVVGIVVALVVVVLVVVVVIVVRIVVMVVLVLVLVMVVVAKPIHQLPPLSATGRVTRPACPVTTKLLLLLPPPPISLKHNTSPRYQHTGILRNEARNTECLIQ
ncbi:hypothetical protein E2C01_062428 [Portunus trituberculatus]|uniref:Uncharacterized protein n=1 Tax=Portunus trituberculatus TaxID=210409 RepID=A0A5B7H7U7_PORTR|nr:hypothetical protein [Portunus trituberculatus]